MVQLFRKIRHRLLTENRFTKYLLYAVGEIILVVIGILIALQINNSNEYQKLRDREVILLTELRDNLVNDTLDLRYNIRNNNKRIRSNEVILQALTTSQAFHDSLTFHFGNLFGNFQFIENTSAWENLKSSGLDLISNDSLRNAISKLYSTHYQYLENFERGADDRYQWDHFYPQLLENLSIDTMWRHGSPVDFENLKEDRKFKETIKMNLFLRRSAQYLYEKTYDQVLSTLLVLDKHIQALKKKG